MKAKKQDILVSVIEFELILQPNLERKMEISMKGSKVRMVLLKPAMFWQREKVAPTGLKELLGGYFLPLVLTAGVAEFIGKMLWGSGFYVIFPLMRAMREVLLFMLFYIISVFISNYLIGSFGGKKNLNAVKRLVAYSIAPAILINILTNLFPFLYVLEILGLYSFFIFLAGAEILLEFPGKNHIKYILVTLLVNFVVFSFLSIFLSRLVTEFL